MSDADLMRQARIEIARAYAELPDDETAKRRFLLDPRPITHAKRLADRTEEEMRRLTVLTTMARDSNRKVQREMVKLALMLEDLDSSRAVVAFGLRSSERFAGELIEILPESYERIVKAVRALRAAGVETYEILGMGIDRAHVISRLALSPPERPEVIRSFATLAYKTKPAVDILVQTIAAHRAASKL